MSRLFFEQPHRPSWTVGLPSPIAGPRMVVVAEGDKLMLITDRYQEMCRGPNGSSTARK